MDRKRAITIAAAVAAVAAPFEGLRQVAYYDPPGILTVCYGHTGDVQKGKVYTPSECKALLQGDALEAVTTVLQCVPNAPDSVAVAFGDAVFNIGPRIACDKSASTAARMLAAGDWAGACNQLPRWNKTTIAGQLVELRGLTRRREEERQICLEGLS
jgi:GH24 family phage-related lysozyme (muramidase)